MYNVLYAETTIKKNNSFIIKTLELLWVIATLYLTVFSTFFVFSFTLIIITLLDIILLILFLPNIMFREYEYIFCDGQIDIDIIKRRRKRKHIKRYDLSDCDAIAHISDKRLKEYTLEFTKDFTTGTNRENEYGLIFRYNDRYVMVKLEPTMKMLDMMYQKLPRKTFILPKHEKMIKAMNEGVEYIEDDEE